MRTMRLRRFALPLALGLLAGACSSKNGGDDPASFDHLEVEPASATLAVTLGGTAARDYQVFGVRGSSRTDITKQCLLSINPEFGTFAGATVTVVAHGGKTAIDALCDESEAHGEITITMSGTVVDPSAPGDAAKIFGDATAGTDAARTPIVEYPFDKAVSPRNIPSIDVQWKASGNDLFHITLSSVYGTVEMYTANVEAALSSADWESLAATAAGDTLKIVIEGLSRAAPTTKYAAAPVSVTMSRDRVDQTAIYYWASSSGNIMNQTFGETTPPALVKDDCTSCHSVSRQGSRIGYSRCVANDCGSTWVGFLRYDGATQKWNEAVNANDKKIQGSYTTFSPVGNPFTDDTRSVAIVTMSNGTLSLYDPDTGKAVASNIAVSSNDPATGMPASGRSALMPDWSQDGRSIVFSSTSQANRSIDLDLGTIATMSYEYVAGEHRFGAPRQIVPNPITLPNGTYSNFFFPSFSPDGELVAFNAARSYWRNGSDAKAAGQRMMLADSKGTWHRDLTALNGGDIDADITWAHWAPAASDDYYWMVFSSERDYGHKVNASTSPDSCKKNGVKQCKQIWIGAIAKNKVGSGDVDPSTPPMWLPGQDPNTANISPYWSVPPGLQ